MLESTLSMALEPLFITKLIFLIVLGMYSAFAFVLSSQIKTMNAIVEIKNSSALLYAVSLIHLVLVLSLFIAGLVIL
ncbi:MAG: hypothetical protein A3F31_01765 [Candidatus Levybacteria bacterium RIFCSPHIGHO2_12_FULL_38_12]|nr:MAG: hypothetical protein A2770_03225 [Candidatus Levybacteria bacterium RIFCSPHIGHO2_01_FULL_38_12]OGH22204.1 MAG: hypothetical protein A3F31_01765 [Candidatus Levybacteria bacterium RIFCSPHIGHO2_12_FULL_38_12]OGH34368.1 MAG: hypothetical protein A3A47_02125 [Candidatus Levybacteria bacterium RIFCSPLOWO2_01_FULL_37_20]OGH44250.1 MAG: hypothetical protein A3J14_01710 [Candidatus Levybacteria bacterium RIFCSPLOWO2_02_FULL_37_18]OGH51696.1 MAG: hypothetical protein A3G13_00595 [Candidatus Levy